MVELFISEPIFPVTAAMDTARMAVGEPGLPKEFIWRGKTVTVEKVLRHWRETGPCRHGSGEMYLRKHWYEVRTITGEIMKVYFQKPAKGGRKNAGWQLFTLRETGPGA